MKQVKETVMDPTIEIENAAEVQHRRFLIAMTVI
jgi:hypothetical protein